jgi:hypothetical protein
VNERAGVVRPRGGRVNGTTGNYAVLDESVRGDDGFWTHSCGTQVQGVNVAMSVWYRSGPGPCAGTGEVVNRTVPYCPTCEDKPNSTGVLYAD